MGRMGLRLQGNDALLEGLLSLMMCHLILV